MHRFFIFNEQSEPLKEITPTKELFHQLTKVLRIRKNEEFICIYKNLELTTIISEDKLKVIGSREFEVNKKNKITLIQGAPLNKKLSQILQKATELDVDNIIVWQSKRSTSKIDDFSSKLERYEKIIVEACEQTRRNDIPRLSFIKELDEFDFSNKNVITLYEDEKEIYFTDKIKKSSEEIVVIIGPEGGFEPSEISYLKEKGSEICSIGKNILRTETAAIASLAIINSLLRK